MDSQFGVADDPEFDGRSRVGMTSMEWRSCALRIAPGAHSILRNESNTFNDPATRMDSTPCAFGIRNYPLEHFRKRSLEDASGFSTIDPK